MSSPILNGIKQILKKLIFLASGTLLYHLVWNSTNFHKLAIRTLVCTNCQLWAEKNNPRFLGYILILQAANCPMWFKGTQNTNLEWSQIKIWRYLNNTDCVLHWFQNEINQITCHGIEWLTWVRAYKLEVWLITKTIQVAVLIILLKLCHAVTNKMTLKFQDGCHSQSPIPALMFFCG